jgi:two-component system cell cycle response regulator
MTKGTVLIVDDDRDIVAFVADALEAEGYDVLSGLEEEALRLAHDKHPDVILLDIMMPGMDGEEVSRRLRADPATAGIPIVAMSAHERLRSTAARMPMDDQLPKPFHLQNLYTTVQRWAPPEAP